jgi:hypothetical protein
VLKDSLGRLYLKSMALQAAIAIPVVLLALVWRGGLEALSALVGVAAVVTGGFTYTVLARESRVTAVAAGVVLRRHVFAELAKIFVVGSLMLGALASGWFVAGWLVAALGVSLIGHWFLVFFIR